MISYRATLDVPRELAQYLAMLLLAERRQRGTPRGSRALTCFGQAVLGHTAVTGDQAAGSGALLPLSELSRAGQNLPKAPSASATPIFDP